jgi:hypothetical protein
VKSKRDNTSHRNYLVMPSKNTPAVNGNNIGTR